MADYSYPINTDWTTEEIVKVVNFLAGIEKAYQDGIRMKELNALYREFKKVVDSISGEKQLDREFKKRSGYSTYVVVKELKQLLKDNSDQNHLIKVKKEG